MLKRSEIDALVYLLDDTDEFVIRQVEERILSLGEDVIPFLEDGWGTSLNSMQQERIENIIHRIQFNATKANLQHWMDAGIHDLFEGIFILSKYQYPDLDKQVVNNKINKIKLEAWLELNYDLSSLEKVRILNHIFYEIYNFRGNTANYHSPQNSFINTVLETKLGNPISLAILYSIVAQRLNIPIFGVNLPQHFILAFKDDADYFVPSKLNAEPNLNYDQPGDILFYINPFNKGLVFTRPNIDQFLRQLKIEPQNDFYLPCSNVEILKRVIRNLVYSFNQTGQTEKVNELAELMVILGGTVAELKDDQEGESGEEGDE